MSAILLKIALTALVFWMISLMADFTQWLYDGEPTHKIQEIVRLISGTILAICIIIALLINIWTNLP